LIEAVPVTFIEDKLNYCKAKSNELNGLMTNSQIGVEKMIAQAVLINQIALLEDILKNKEQL
jgi:hypothetical protein